MFLSTGSRKRLIILFYAFIIIASFASFIYFMPNDHNLIILNRASAEVEVLAVRINNKYFGANNKVLYPTSPKECRNNPDKYLDFRFKAARDSDLVIDIKDKANKKIKMSCKLIDKNRVGCVHYASIRDEGILTCNCDSNADFYD